MMISRITLLVSVIALLAGAESLQPQDLSLRVAAGAAIPVGAAGERRDAGPAAMLSVESRLSRLWSLRLDGEWSRLKGRPAPAGHEHFSEYLDLRTVGLSLNGLLRLSQGEIAPYLLAGIGAYRLQRVGGPPNPYGTTGALQAGFGMNGNIWERVNPFVEARALVHVTDYGSDEWSPTVTWPVLIGVRIR